MKSTQGIGIQLLDGLFLGLMVLLSGAPAAIATPTEMACPEGWRLHTQELNPQIRVCLPKHLHLPTLSDLSRQPAQVQVQQLRIIQTGAQIDPSHPKESHIQSSSRTSIQVYQHTSQ
ncbi:hypothetical protein AWQ21_13020 [Picosynechococcus sp. PCC 7003]|uniref:hypothetical protein n=1 Tax=Picosynechococcus sp. PCC 7003 TaxID=374981 RepID=UPI0008104B4F|nr:hypothetical protein [Picosynechococcus sp. PCC 7003]ANV85215.1 hypothetical protein AWQ21_13020 [Picosynechococcus sp. PCC 7003]